MFRYLFADTPSHYDLFNKVDTCFFSKVHSLFYERISMFLCRLGDPATQGSNKNLTLETLKDAANEGIEDELFARLSDYRKSIVKFRNMRNKYYSHYDKQLALGPSKTLFSRADVEVALLKLREYMNAFRLHHGEAHMMYEHVITYSSGEELVWALQHSIDKTNEG